MLRAPDQKTTKVLVAAKRLALDRSSEGICSSKYLLALAHGGLDVMCVTTDEAASTNGNGAHGAWLKPVRLQSVWAVPGTGPWTRVAALSGVVAGQGAAGAYAARKLNAAWAYASGWNFSVWYERERWVHAIWHAVRSERPGVIVTRGAGDEFAVYAAMLKSRPPVPWIANYHDPFPVSLYPLPYRRRVPFISRRQEALHRRIVASADALTFPSERMLRWVLSGELERHRQKAFVLPHIASDACTGDVVPESMLHYQGAEGVARGAPGAFTIVHTGTVLRERNPQALLRGFVRFLDQDPRRRQLARLVFLGGVDRTHLTSREWTELAGSGNFEHRDCRVSYHAALDLARQAAVVVILEANAAESPFFPAKLADYVWLRKPILALSPRQSATSDILGADHPLRVSPDDSAAVMRALTLLWEKWTAGQLADLLPEPRIAASLSEGAVQNQFRQIVSYATSRPVSGAS